MPKKQLHGQLVKQVRQILELDGWSTVGIRAGAFSEKGIWDIYADRNGIALWLEIKIPPDKLSDHQLEFMRKRWKQGIRICMVSRLEDLDGMGILSKKVRIQS